MEEVEVAQEVAEEVLNSAFTQEQVTYLLQCLTDIRTLLALIFFAICAWIGIKILYVILCKILFK